ncbi:MAG: DoxX family protein [Bacteroidetes bacterium]|nr:MAG: DoxX family protein [Bacteroidota bacterium]
MTSLPTLIISFALVGLALTVATKLTRRTDNVLLSFLQHFTGVWFVFSGIVKAIDPIGTAYKMEDYFAAFESTFEGLQNVFAGLAPVFPALAQYSAGFSIIMIVLEIALGVMLILGYSRRLTAWLFLLIVLFFTFLTGFTYLTGFVPTEANFFDFAQWGPYIKTQMRVTDCGCFGDFIKLDPKVSFFKDLGLLIPAFLFLFFHQKMHELLTPRGRNFFVGLTAVASLIFCWQNTYNNLPVVDFRPFKEGANIRDRKALEEEARGNIEIIGWVMENTNTGEVTKAMIPMDRYKELVAQYPKEAGWKVKDQIKTDPFIEEDGKRVTITESKVSDFAIESEDGEVTEDILSESGYSLMVVAYKFYGEKVTETVVVQDTVWAYDTIQVSLDSMHIEARIESVGPKEVEREAYHTDPHYGDLYRKQVNPLAAAAADAGWKVYAVNTYQDTEATELFREDIGAPYPFYHGDDKLLKTIIRSNPGIVIWKDGAILAKYHWKHLPDPETLLKRFQ